jgi:chromosomal replication initiator protein
MGEHLTESAQRGDRQAAAGTATALAAADRSSAAFLAQTWGSVLAALERRLPREAFETWFRRATLVAAPVGGPLVIAVQNQFARDWITGYYRDALETAALEALGAPHAVVLRVDPEAFAVCGPCAGPAPASAQAAPAAHSGMPTGARDVQPGRAHAAPPRAGAGGPALLRHSDVVLNPGYRFDTFVVGPCNRFAHASAMGVAEAPSRAYNPFFLHGSVGLGKTHLLQSLCRSILERDPGVSILYLSCETFINHFINALETADLPRFRNKYRRADVLVVDDIHLLTNKERTQDEFFHTFNSLHNGGKQIVLSSDSPPRDIPALQDRLVSRFSQGLVTELERPCYETRVAILRRKARERGCELGDDVARLIAERLDTNIRELEGAVVKLVGYASLSRQPVSPDLARQCLRELFSERERQIGTDDVLRVVAEEFGIKPADVQSRRRTNQIAFPRQVGMYLCRRLTRLSLSEIGGFFGGRDHSTVLYAVEKITEAARADADLRLRLERLEAGLRRLV